MVIDFTMSNVIPARVRSLASTAGTQVGESRPAYHPSGCFNVACMIDHKMPEHVLYEDISDSQDDARSHSETVLSEESLHAYKADDRDILKRYRSKVVTVIGLSTLTMTFSFLMVVLTLSMSRAVVVTALVQATL
jgi:hypothetical protein